MAEIRPFRAIRPDREKAEHIVALPYDVYNREEARWEVEREPLSFLKIDRPETQFPADADMYSTDVYEKARETLWEMVKTGDFVREERPCYYIYELTMNGRVQDGIVACASIDAYLDGQIRKHENTRKEKEEDRIRHVDACHAQTGPIFLAYRKRETLSGMIEKKKKSPALYDFTSPDGVRHRVFRFDSDEEISTVYQELQQIEDLYIADGHHRAASAVAVGVKRRKENPGYTGEEEYNYFLSVLFADEQLMIMDYNRVVKDLNGYSEEEFLQKVMEIFAVEEITGSLPAVDCKGRIGMYLGGKWYLCQVYEDKRDKDPVKGLDVSVLQDQLLEPILGITDPRTDSRIDFVGGIRGLQELERRVHTDSQVAFAMYPTSIGELFAVANAHLLMPPKSTWFEPKLRNGLFIHEI